MSLFGKIMEKIFAPAAAAPSPSASATNAAPSINTTSPTPMGPVDVSAVLNGLAAKNSQELRWKTSIVDLLKLLNLDSSLSARQDLAKELNYSGDVKDSAAMNTWLHREVMKKLAANGGEVPADLRASA